MTTLIHKFAFIVVASLVAVTFAAAPAVAQTKALLISPDIDPGFAPEPSLPKFGFSSFNVHGIGERVSYVRWGGLAWQFGLESGDLILSMDGYPLSCQGSWNDALYNAMYTNGGWVSLRIRDVRTGHIVSRQMFVGGAGGSGPIVNHFKSNGSVNHFDAPNGPITLKSTIGPQRGNPSPRLAK